MVLTLTCTLPGFSRGAYQVRALAGMIARVSRFPEKCCPLQNQLRFTRLGYFSRETTSKYHCKISRRSGLHII